MIFDRVQEYLMRERVVYSTNCVGKLDIHMQKNECERIHMQKNLLVLILHHIQKSTQDGLNIRSTTGKNRAENKGHAS